MTPEQLDEIEELAEEATSDPWCVANRGGDVTVETAGMECFVVAEMPRSGETSMDDARFIRAMREYALPLVKALREAWARCELLRELADEKAYAAGLYARRMEEAQKARSEALAEAKKWHLKYDCLKGDADVAVMEMNAAVEFADNAGAKVERLREVVRKVHGLAGMAMSGTAVWEPLVDIHKLTKQEG